MECVKTESIREKIECFSRFGDTGNGGITRFALSPADNLARAEFIRRMKTIGAELETDDLANLYATLPGRDASLKSIAAGSHTDSVRCGGNYDGILGVIGAMEALETVAREKIPHRHPLTAVVWTNEEGAEFPPAMFSSGILTGQFEKEALLKTPSAVDPRITFGDVLAKSPYLGSPERRLTADRCGALFELHIEQGPILEDAGKDIGVVTCVLGMINYRLTLRGQATHAGTTPMPKRKDALFAAARLLIELHDRIDALGCPDLVYTTGEITCHPCVHTVVPEVVSFSIDSRHKDPEVLKKVTDILRSYQGAQIEGCACSVERDWDRDTVFFDKTLVGCVQKSVDELGYSNQEINSGAGHDAQYIAKILPAAMIFVPSDGGHSHSELEHTSVEQCRKGAEVLLGAILEADKVLD